MVRSTLVLAAVAVPAPALAHAGHHDQMRMGELLAHIGLSPDHGIALVVALGVAGFSVSMLRRRMAVRRDRT